MRACGYMVLGPEMRGHGCGVCGVKGGTSEGRGPRVGV